MKTCPDCKQTLPAEAFSAGHTRDGLYTYCRRCNSARTKARTDKNPQAYREKNRVRHQANRTAVLEKQRAYYQKNKARILARQRLPAEVNRAKTIAWRKANSEKVKAWRRRATANLTDDYVRDRLVTKTTLSRDQLTPALVAMKREEITLRRLARQLKKVINESRTNTR